MSGRSTAELNQNCHDRGLNPGSSVYETDALPLGHRGSCHKLIKVRIKHNKKKIINKIDHNCPNRGLNPGYSVYETDEAVAII